MSRWSILALVVGWSLACTGGAAVDPVPTPDPAAPTSPDPERPKKGKGKAGKPPADAPRVDLDGDGKAEKAWLEDGADALHIGDAVIEWHVPVDATPSLRVVDVDRGVPGTNVVIDAQGTGDAGYAPIVVGWYDGALKTWDRGHAAEFPGDGTMRETSQNCGQTTVETFRLRKGEFVSVTKETTGIMDPGKCSQ